MTHLRVLATAATTILLAAGCQGAATPKGAAPTDTPAPAQPTATQPGAGRPSAALPSRPAAAPASASPDGGTSPYRVTFGWAVPSRPVEVRHDVAVPIAPAPAPPLPLLVEVRAGDHPDEGYSRVTFAFRGATPSYEFGYVPRVEADGSGNPLPLAGNAFIRIRFTPAQAHDEQGRATVATAPRTLLTLPTLRSYGFGGDFEGYVTFGLGIQVAAGSDQVLPVRVGELVRADGSHVVAVDVRRG